MSNIRQLIEMDSGGGLGLGFGGGSLSSKILSLFKGTGDQVGLFREDVGVASAYWMCQHIGSGRYWCAQLLSKTTGGKTLHVLNSSQIRAPFMSVHKADASFTFGGAGWTSSSTITGSYGGSYQRGTVAGATCTITTPANTTMAGVHWCTAPNAGLMLISIDASLTLATRCKTAQQVVDDGTYANTILIANGGTLNPTDRVVDLYSASNVGDVVVLLADDLASGAHTIVITITGYKRAAATDIRAYVAGLTYNTATLTIGTASIYMYPLDNLFSYASGSVWEYAFTVKYAGNMDTDFVGNAHGYDNQTSIVYKVDGQAVTPANLAVVAGTTSVEVTRVSELTSSVVDAGATKVADISTVYTMTPTNGLEIAWMVDWRVALQLWQAYAAMYPVDQAIFDRGRNIGGGGVLTLSTGDGTYKGIANGNMLWCWDYDGVYGALCYVPDPTATLENQVYCDVNKSEIEDRATAPLNKMYMSRASFALYRAVGVDERLTSDSYRRVVSVINVNSYLG